MADTYLAARQQRLYDGEWRGFYSSMKAVAIEDSALWDLIQELHNAEIAHFGRRYSEGSRELKAKKILKRKTFARARSEHPVLPNEIPGLAKAILDSGAENGTPRHLKALSLAKIGYVTDVLSICDSYNCRTFASIVDPDAPQTASGGLRKDYGYLFERFFNFLEDKSSSQQYPQQGILVFDQLEKSQSHLLIDQTHRYFREAPSRYLDNPRAVFRSQ